jgi:hypothetical protein
MKVLRDNSVAKVGRQVRVLRSEDGLKKGDIVTLTAIEGTVKNQVNADIDLNRWKDIVQCTGNWLINIRNLEMIY